MVAIASCCHRRKLSSESLKEIGMENLIGENVGEEPVEEAGEAICSGEEASEAMDRARRVQEKVAL